MSLSSIVGTLLIEDSKEILLLVRTRKRGGVHAPLDRICSESSGPLRGQLDVVHPGSLPENLVADLDLRHHRLVAILRPVARALAEDRARSRLGHVHYRAHGPIVVPSRRAAQTPSGICADTLSS